MRHKVLSLLAAVVLVVAVGSMAKADTVTAGGITYTFTSTFVPVTGNTYAVTLTIDANGATAGGTLSSFSVQFTGATGVTIASASVGTWSAPATGPNTSHGCNANPGNHWCTSAISGAPSWTVPPGGGVYTFVFDVTMPTGDPLPTGTHIQAFQGSSLAISDDVTENIGTVPEPASLILLGTGLLGIAGLLRRKLFA